MAFELGEWDFHLLLCEVGVEGELIEIMSIVMTPMEIALRLQSTHLGSSFDVVRSISNNNVADQLKFTISMTLK